MDTLRRAVTAAIWTAWAFLGIAVIAHATDYNRAPWDKWGCTYDSTGEVTDYPCIDNRYAPDVEVWRSIDTSRMKVYPRVSDTFDACGGEYACTIGGVVHVTAGDSSALILALMGKYPDR